MGEQAEWFWAEPGRVIAGRYPGAWDDEPAARAKLAAILAEDVSLFVDLTEERQDCPQTGEQRAVIRGRRAGA